jgi:hypothetical protein
MGFAEIRVQMRRVRGALTRMLADDAEITRRVAEALEALEEGERLLDELAAAGPAVAVARRGVRKSYRVDKHDEGEFLEEWREGENVPFRVRRSAYESIAAVMTRFKDAVAYEEIARSVKKQTGEALPEYAIRTVLRFWVERRLIQRSRSRYRRSSGGEWPTSALNAWREARRTGP